MILVLRSFGQHISLVINTSCQTLTFALKSFQQRLRCSRGFTVSVTMNLLKLHLICIKTESENIANRKTLPSFSFILFSLHMNKTLSSLYCFFFMFVLTNAYVTLQRGCALITNDVFFSKREWQSWGTIIFMYANTTFQFALVPTMTFLFSFYCFSIQV